MKGDFAFHPDGEGEKIPGREVDCTATIPGGGRDGSIDGPGIVGFAITPGAEIEHIVKHLFS